jgi:hypothetical protein
MQWLAKFNPEKRLFYLSLISADPEGPGLCSLALTLLSFLLFLSTLPLSLCMCIKVSMWHRELMSYLLLSFVVRSLASQRKWRSVKGTLARNPTSSLAVPYCQACFLPCREEKENVEKTRTT